MQEIEEIARVSEKTRASVPETRTREREKEGETGYSEGKRRKTMPSTADRKERRDGRERERER